MDKNQRDDRMLTVIAATLVLQVVLSAVLLVRISSLTQDISALLGMYGNPGSQALDEEVVADVSTEGAPCRGSDDAQVTIVVFSDFGCSACAAAWSTLTEILDTYPGTVRIAHRDFPLTTDPDSLSVQAANAARCAGEQGRYWEMHDLLFANQAGISPDGFATHASSIGVDIDAFQECVDTLRYAEEIQSDQEAGVDAGVQAVPTVFINGRLVEGALPLSAYQLLVEQQLEN